MKLLNLKRFLLWGRRSFSSGHNNHSSYKVGKIIHGYEVKRIVKVPTFSMTAIELQHGKTGSSHLHLERDDKNNVFNVLLRTTPMNSSGVAHVLEHVALCGSQQYPVRDPFFKMLTRSMSSFMNAMTGSDFTMYPFSTQHAEIDGKKRTSTDFKNLMSVYLDSVFFPRIRKMDFLQEGWRLEHEDIDNPDSSIMFKGVVFNEMKGLMADPSYLYGTAIQNHLLPDHTYGVCSGGRPSDIPNLTWEDLKEFHKTHYHPSNAKFITYGNLPLESHLELINDKVMSKFDRIDIDTDVPPQRLWGQPKTASISCPHDAMAPNPDQQTTLSMNYLMPEVSNVEEGMTASVICNLLIDGPASPFYKSLIESGLGSDYSPNTGYHNHIREGLFSVGLQGLSNSKVDEVKQIIKSTIDDVIENGFPQDRVEAILHGIELQNKHQSSNFGLGLTFNVMPVWQHGADPVELLQVDDLVKKFEDKLKKDPDFLKKKCKEYFKDNSHRLCLSMMPDDEYKEKAEKQEEKNLQDRLDELSSTDKELIFEQGKELRDDQDLDQDLSCLPSLKVSDIPLKQEAYQVEVGPSIFNDNPHVIVTSSQPTNGVTYFKSVIPIDELREDLIPYVPLFCDVLTQVGTESVDYVTFSKRVDLCTGGLSASVSTSCVHDLMLTETYITLKSHCLDRNTEKMFDLWQELFHGVNLKDEVRIRTLIRQSAQDLANSVAFKGHVFAMNSSAQHVSPSGRYEEIFSGLTQVKLMQTLAESNDVSDVVSRLNEIASYVLHRHVMTHADEVNGRSMVHSTAGSIKAAKTMLEKFVQSKPERDRDPSLTNDLVSTNQIQYIDSEHDVICRPVRWLDFAKRIPHTLQHYHELPTHVNFTSMCIPTAHAYNSELSPTLKVAAKLMSSKYLHREIREKGGAYGGGARHEADGLFRFFSYRDPNNLSTIEVFRSGLKWLESGSFTSQDVDEAKLAIFQSVDAPVSPCNRGMSFFLHGLTNQMQQQHRERLLAVNTDNIVEAARSLMDIKSPGVAIIGPENKDLKQSKNWIKDL